MQKVSPSFHQKSQASVRHHSWALLFSFDKEFDNKSTFFTLDRSLLNGKDILAPVGDKVLQYWDFYRFAPYTDRLISMEWSRELEFPYSVQSCIATVTLNNIDNYFSSHTGSPIDQYLIPSRPVKIFSGFNDEPFLQQFVGLTQDKPELDRDSNTAKFQALDYLSELFKLKLSDTISESNINTADALALLFRQFGIEPNQFKLERGSNTIPFLFFSSGEDAAEVFRKIMQAEGGRLWIDETGIFRFDRRTSIHNDIVFAFDESSISSLSVTRDTEIINRVTVTSNIREKQQIQPIHTGSGRLSEANLSEAIVIPKGGTAEYSFRTDDPVAELVEPTNGRQVGTSWFSVRTRGGENIPGGVSIKKITRSASGVSIIFGNSNGYDAFLSAIEVYGAPAKIVDTIDYDAYDQDSIDKYGEHLLKIENDLFGRESNCQSFVYAVLAAYSEFDAVIELTVKSNPALQLFDIIKVDTRKISGTFQITKIASSVSSSGITQTLKARRHTIRSYFILDKSLLNGSDVLAL